MHPRLSLNTSINQGLTAYQLVGMLTSLARNKAGRGLNRRRAETKRSLPMDTFLVATQIVCYGVGLVSASLNIASFVHRRGKWRRLHIIRRRLTHSTMLAGAGKR